MTHRYIKIGITGVVLVGAFVAMLWTTLRDGAEYFKDVKEVLPQRQVWEGKPLRLHGYVVPGSIYRRRDSLDYKFKVQNDPPRVTHADSDEIVEVVYTGIVPDTFKDEAEVTLQGRLSTDAFHADPNGVVAKCPSKYEAASKSVSPAS